MNTFLMSFIITFGAGISTLFGGFIPFLGIKNKDTIVASSLAFAAGIMLSISVLDLIPSAVSYLATECRVRMIIILFGIAFLLGWLIFFLMNKFSTKNVDNLYRVGIFSMIAIIMHNIPEGIITFILSSSDIKLGLLLGISIALHNIPEGISVMVPIYYGTNSFKRAFLYTFVAGIAEPIGGVLFYLLFNSLIDNVMLGLLFSFIAGVMIYLSIWELIPESLEYKRNNLSLSWFLIGIIFFLIVHIFLN